MRITRGKQQILHRYLPTRTFDFQGGVIARIETVSGLRPNELNPRFLIARIREDAEAWPEEARPSLRDTILSDPSKFFLIDPLEVRARLYPLVFWCDRCGRVFDHTVNGRLPTTATCSKCGQGRLAQLRFVRVHRCGELRPLTPPTCKGCRKNKGNMALITYGSERVRDFQWKCQECSAAPVSVFPGNCPACEWDGDPALKRMQVLVHRAGPAFYPRTVTLLNVPQRRWDGFFALGEDTWPALAGGHLLGLPGMPSGLEELAASGSASVASVSNDTLSEILSRQASGEITPQEAMAEIASLSQAASEGSELSPDELREQLIQRTGVPNQIWRRAGQELLEAVMPIESGAPNSLLEEDHGLADAERLAEARTAALSLGISQLLLVDDFPIVKGTYGYSRLEPSPFGGGGDGVCRTRLNAFPAQPNTRGLTPVLVDEVRADALMITLDHSRVLRWLDANGIDAEVPQGTDDVLRRRAYPIALFDEAPLRQTLRDPATRMVFGLLHSVSHLAVRQAALLCGLDRTSLSEYLLPRALTAAIYCNHRFGATIGALTALYEQSLVEWLGALASTTSCVYDPVCAEREAACHACLHLAETSCTHFNLNLGRAFLFGGNDPVIGTIQTGYYDSSLSPSR